MIIENKGDYVRFLGKVRLIPGTNDISKEYKEEVIEALKHPLNQYLTEANEIIVPDALFEQDGISDINATKAGILIKDTFSLETLNQFLEQEKSGTNRKKVIDAINKQIESISNPPIEEQYAPEEDSGK
ncbi:hypothetical protein GLX70_07085 [Listeria monocytogenes]|uniref:hypothetical protein n=1 Tax=Listeria monocytogenes TaxID=1639 RepID=UPI000BDEAEA2|nr:hypothetical protein [Listeria monocytogenes]EAC5079581.1 hypothetical protein [Listeria monocytogenes]EAC6159065.1 hypothetical protein [Listeria monocytogenes]EAC7675199.1 hypothetical protein [Listeria monocytogenes]EAC7684156.1 hypothetical protein [Listeria monocytogenes]EAC7838734.1 hypothetical protein [Listeria monocytogenes]